MLTNRFGETSGSFFQENLTPTIGNFFRFYQWKFVFHVHGFAVCAQGCQRAVDQDLGEVGKQLLSTILRGYKFEQEWILVQETGGDRAFEELFMVENVEQKWNVGLDA